MNLSCLLYTSKDRDMSMPVPDRWGLSPAGADRKHGSDHPARKDQRSRTGRAHAPSSGAGDSKNGE